MLVNKVLLGSRIPANVRLISIGSKWNRSAESDVHGSYYKQQASKQAQNEEASGRPSDWDTAIPYDSIPGPKPLPFVGNSIRFLFGEFRGMDILDIQKVMYNKYGKVSILKGLLGINDAVMLFDPEHIEKFYRQEGIWPYREIMPSLCEYRTKIRKDFFDTAPGILTVQGEEWFNTRSKVNPILMQPRTVQNYTDAMNDVATDMITIIRRLSSEHDNNEMPKNFETYIQDWALEAVACMAVSRRLGCLSDNPPPETKELIKALDRTFNSFFKLDFDPSSILRKKFNTGTWKAFVTDMDYVTVTVKKHIDDARKDIAAKKGGTDSEGEQSVLEKLLALDEKIAITMVIDMFMAGVDTTTKSAGIALYHLTKNKDAQDKLREELRSLMPTPDSPVTKDVLNNANYLKASIKETMRLNPVAIGTVRRCVKDVVIGGYQIPKGTDVMSSNAFISRLEENYKRANEFIPERWLRSTTDALSHKNTSPFVTMPFGFGPRSCVGQRLATLELQILIAKVIRNFELEWPHKDMRFITFVTHGCADPLQFKMVPVTH